QRPVEFLDLLVGDAEPAFLRLIEPPAETCLARVDHAIGTPLVVHLRLRIAPGGAALAGAARVGVGRFIRPVGEGIGAIARTDLRIRAALPPGYACHDLPPVRVRQPEQGMFPQSPRGIRVLRWSAATAAHRHSSRAWRASRLSEM